MMPRGRPGSLYTRGDAPGHAVYAQSSCAAVAINSRCSSANSLYSRGYSRITGVVTLPALVLTRAVPRARLSILALVRDTLVLKQ